MASAVVSLLSARFLQRGKTHAGGAFTACEAAEVINQEVDLAAICEWPMGMLSLSLNKSTAKAIRIYSS